MPESAPLSAPPVAKKVPIERTHHGHTFVDEYEWLRDKENPDVIAYLEAENAWTEQQTADLAPLREKIFDEIKSRTQETDMSVPTRLGDYAKGASVGLRQPPQLLAPVLARLTRRRTSR